MRAIAHSPSYATGRQWYAQFLAYRGGTTGALEEIRRAPELDPLSPAIQTTAGTVLCYARRYEEAAEQFQRALALEPSLYLARLQLGAVYLQQQRFPAELAETAEAVRLTPVLIGSSQGEAHEGTPDARHGRGCRDARQSAAID